MMARNLIPILTLVASGTALADGKIRDEDIYSAAAIKESKLLAKTPTMAAETDASGFFTTDPNTTAIELGYVHGVTSAIQTQLNSMVINPMTTLGDLIYENATPAPARLAGNTTTTKNLLCQTGTGTISAAPSWCTLASGDIPNNAANTTGNAATATAFASTPTGCGVGLYGIGQDVHGNFSCSNVPYSAVTGTPTLYYQTVDINGVAQTQRSAIDFSTEFSAADSSSPSKTTISIATNGVANSKLAQMPANTIKGNNTGSTANAADLTATQVTAMLNAYVGDSGSGGTKGEVSAPAAGDCAAGKFASACGGWSVPAGGGGGGGASVVIKSIDYTLAGTESDVSFTAAKKATLPDCSGLSADMAVWIDNFSLGVVTIAAGGSNTISTYFGLTGTSYQISEPGSVRVKCTHGGSTVYVSH